MDPMLAMMGGNVDEEQMALMAQMLRGQSGTGGRLSTSTIEPVARQGRQMQSDALGTANQVGLSRYRNKAIEEQQKDREARVLTAALAAQAKGKEGKKYKLSDSAAKNFRERIETIGTIKDLSTAFRDDYAGTIPLAGDVENWVANQGIGTEGMKAQSQWWGDWKKFYENIERNRLFGSALTDSEQRQWKASNITPNMDPDQIRSRLETLNRLSQKMAAYEANDLTLRGHGDYAQEMIESLDILPREAFDDLKGYMQNVGKSVRGSEYPKSFLQDMSDEELLRMRDELSGGR